MNWIERKRWMWDECGGQKDESGWKYKLDEGDDGEWRRWLWGDECGWQGWMGGEECGWREWMWEDLYRKVREMMCFDWLNEFLD